MNTTTKTNTSNPNSTNPRMDAFDMDLARNNLATKLEKALDSANRKLKAKDLVDSSLDQTNKPSMQSLPPIPAIKNLRTINGTSLKVDRRVGTIVEQEVVPVICSHTGITIELVIPVIFGVALEYKNPLAIYKNVKGIIEQGSGYLNKLDLQILAGLWITAYRHYDLFEQANGKQNSTILNAILRTATKEVLIDSLSLILHIDSRNSLSLPKFSLDYAAHKEFQSVAPALQEYSRTIRASLYPEILISKKSSELDSLLEAKYQDNASYVARKIKTRLSSSERAYEEQFVANRREAKELLAALTESRAIPSLLIAKLKPVFIGKNLVAMASTTRAIVVAKLNSYNSPDAHRLATIVAEGHNPYDLFASIDDAFTETETNLVGVEQVSSRKRSLAEILAEKKASKTSEAAEPRNTATGSGNGMQVTASLQIEINTTKNEDF